MGLFDFGVKGDAPFRRVDPPGVVGVFGFSGALAAALLCWLAANVIPYPLFVTG